MPAVGTSNNQIRQAIYAILNADVILLSQGMTGVFDVGAVPENQQFWYIVLGESTETMDDTFDQRGYDNTLSLHLWDRARGFQRLYTALGRIIVLLHRKQLTLSSQYNVGVWYINALSILGTDGLSQHVMLRLRLFTQEPL